MLSFRTGDLFESNADVLTNTVNCVGVMGAGVALAFKTRYPEMFRAYKRECRLQRLKPGRLHIWDDPSGVAIINFPTKLHWREPSRYEYIELGLISLRGYLSQRGQVRVALPALGCGHGGLDWSRVSEMIRKHLSDLPADIEVFDPSFSHSIGPRVARKGPEGLTYRSHPIGVETIAPGESSYPSALRGVIDATFYAKGPLDLLNRPLLAVLPSAKPSEREVKAALECIEAIVRPGITLLIGYGADVERPAIRIALERGASVAICLAEGLVNFRVRRDLRDVWDDRRVVVFSTVRPDQRWRSTSALKARRLELALAKIALITDPSPTWLQRPSRTSRLHTPEFCFYINYQAQDPDVRHILDALNARPVARSAKSGLPNVTRLLQSIGADGGCGTI